MIGIIDTGINNLGSIYNCLNYLNLDYGVIKNRSDLLDFDNYILPGVGSFDAGIEALEENGLYDAIKEIDFSKKRILGICLGMQLLCNSSDEGTKSGLGIIDADIMHLKNLGCNSKIPHVGFNEIVNADNKSIFLNKLLNRDFYFVHSYAAKINDEKISYAMTEYNDLQIVAAINYKNIFATQFHPEKSGVNGITIIRDIFE